MNSTYILRIYWSNTVPLQLIVPISNPVTDVNVLDDEEVPLDYFLGMLLNDSTLRGIE